MGLVGKGDKVTGQTNGFGVSFLPGGDQRYQRPEDQQGPLGAAPLQEAIKILSLRVPRVVGANPLAPLALLGGQGSGGMQPGQLATLMRTLGVQPQMQTQQVPGAGGPDMAIGGAPSPFAAMQQIMPTGREGFLGGRPPAGGPIPNLTIGGGTPTGGLLPAEPPSAPAAPAAQPDSGALYELARRQRESMGRIAY